MWIRWHCAPQVSVRCLHALPPLQPMTSVHGIFLTPLLPAFTHLCLSGFLTIKSKQLYVTELAGFLGNECYAYRTRTRSVHHCCGRYHYYLHCVFLLYYFTYTSVHLQTCLCTECVPVPMEGGEGTGASGTGVTGSRLLLCGVGT